MTNLSSLPGFSSGSSGGGGGGSSSSSFPQLCNYTPVSSVEQSLLAHKHVNYYHVVPGGFNSSKHCNAYGLFRTYYEKQTGTYGHETGTKVQGVTVNPANGQLTLRTDNQGWNNGSGSNLSTTYLTYEPYTGCFMMGGHNAWPGASGHVFGHFYGRIDTNGDVQNTSASQTNKDHGYNGLFFSEYNSNGYFVTAGYDQNSSSHCHWRGWQGSRSGAPSNQWDTVTSNYTSSSSGQQFYSQPDYTPSGNQIVGGVGLSLNNSPSNGYGRGFVAANGNRDTYDTANNTAVSSSTGYSTRPHFRHSSGVWINPYEFEYNWTWANYNNAPQDNPYSGDEQFTNSPDIKGSNYHHQHIGLGNDHWLSFNALSSNTGNMKGKVCLWKIDANLDPVTIQIFEQGSGDASAMFSGDRNFFTETCTWHPVYASSSAAYPSYLMAFYWKNSRQWCVNCYEITINFADYIS